MAIHWHRRDLRATDNVALASQSTPVVPVFVLDPAILAYASPPRVAFMLDSLAALREWYRERDSDLLVREGDPREVLPAVANEHDAERIVWNHDYTGLASRRDQGVERSVGAADLESRQYHDLLMHEPGSITTQAGDAYEVFSYFWRKWDDRPAPEPVGEPAKLAAVSGAPLPSLSELGFDEPEASIQAGGIDAASERLESFLEGPLYKYEQTRDEPAAAGTSRLSAHLRWGTIGIRTVHEQVCQARASAPDEAAVESCNTFRQQLAWRSFYTHVLDSHPKTVREAHKEFPSPIEWRDDPAELAAWKAGETGYPLVDAGMRQLLAEGFMHNRARMVVASFLTKDLLIDWREGYEWFRERLVDHDPANDAGGWQWAAGTGTDAQPYFRVFNPSTQCERHDPDGAYVRSYVPELRDVATETIHAWPSLEQSERDAVAPDYPVPIVDHQKRREMAIAMFESAREN